MSPMGVATASVEENLYLTLNLLYRWILITLPIDILLAILVGNTLRIEDDFLVRAQIAAAVVIFLFYNSPKLWLRFQDLKSFKLGSRSFKIFILAIAILVPIAEILAKLMKMSVMILIPMVATIGWALFKEFVKTHQSVNESFERLKSDPIFAIQSAAREYLVISLIPMVATRLLFLFSTIYALIIIKSWCLVFIYLLVAYSLLEHFRPTREKLSSICFQCGRSARRDNSCPRCHL